MKQEAMDTTVNVTWMQLGSGDVKQGGHRATGGNISDGKLIQG